MLTPATTLAGVAARLEHLARLQHDEKCILLDSTEVLTGVFDGYEGEIQRSVALSLATARPAKDRRCVVKRLR